MSSDSWASPINATMVASRSSAAPSSVGPTNAWIAPPAKSTRFVGGLAHKGRRLVGPSALLLVRGSLSGADDGIRTRDPHLGKVVLYR